MLFHDVFCCAVPLINSHCKLILAYIKSKVPPPFYQFIVPRQCGFEMLLRMFCSLAFSIFCFSYQCHIIFAYMTSCLLRHSPSFTLSLLIFTNTECLFLDHVLPNSMITVSVSLWLLYVDVDQNLHSSFLQLFFISVECL